MKIDGKCIEMKNLGVLIDSSLSLVNQKTYVKKKKYWQSCEHITHSRMSSFLDRNARMKLVHILIFFLLLFNYNKIQIARKPDKKQKGNIREGSIEDETGTVLLFTL